MGQKKKKYRLIFFLSLGVILNGKEEEMKWNEREWGWLSGQNSGHMTGSNRVLFPPNAIFLTETCCWTCLMSAQLQLDEAKIRNHATQSLKIIAIYLTQSELIEPVSPKQHN